MIQSLSRIARQNKKLDFPRFQIEAERQLNRERTNDPDNNWSRVEAISGYITPRPLNLRPEDIRVYMDQFGRPDLYARRYCDNALLRWNKDPRYYPLYVYSSVPINATEVTARGRQVEVVYHYIRTIQGKDEVRAVDGHLASTIEGLEDRRASVQLADDIREVQRVRERVWDEIDGLRRG
jgi:hypothetical protein